MCKSTPRNTAFRLDFVGAGVAKSGTSWIASCLHEHPATCIAAGKEANFFASSQLGSGIPLKTHYTTSHFHEGLEWLESLFEHREPGQLLGEFSPGYFGDAESARLLHEHNPQMKLLFVFRDPVETLHALYYQLSRLQPLPSTFEQTLERYPLMIEYCRHRKNIDRFLQWFPREQMFLALYDDLKSDPGGLYQRLCRHLDIDDTYTPEALTRRVNPRRVVRYLWVRDLLATTSISLDKSSLTRSLKRALQKAGLRRVTRTLRKLNQRVGDYVPMQEGTRRKLIEVYRRDNDGLAEVLDRSVSHWNGLS